MAYPDEVPSAVLTAINEYRDALNRCILPDRADEEAAKCRDEKHAALLAAIIEALNNAHRDRSDVETYLPWG